MDIFFEAARQKLRFAVKGQLLAEDLFDVGTLELEALEAGYEATLETEGRSRRRKKTPANTLTQLRLAVVKAVLDYREAATDAETLKAALKPEILALQQALQMKKQLEIQSLSTEELQERLEALTK
jgi:hypothetical protein